jgi:regulatory protein
VLSKIALNLLARREHSRFELQHKLSAKGFTSEDIAKLLQKLDTQGLQSDTRFVENYINMRRSRGFGPLRIKCELKTRGINQETIANFLDENDVAWVDLAKIVYDRKFGKKTPQNSRAKAQQMKYLYYKGFTSDQIRKVVAHDKNM